MCQPKGDSIFFTQMFNIMRDEKCCHIADYILPIFNHRSIQLNGESYRSSISRKIPGTSTGQLAVSFFMRLISFNTAAFPKKLPHWTSVPFADLKVSNNYLLLYLFTLSCFNLDLRGFYSSFVSIGCLVLFNISRHKHD